MGQQLRNLVIHCSATPEDQEITKDDIFRMHTSPKHLGGRGWNRVGYSDMIYLDGSLHNLVPYNMDDVVDLWEISNGAKGINGFSRHVMYVGGMDKNGKKPKDTRTSEQIAALDTYVKFTILRHPGIQVLGHYQAPGANKACPSFDVPSWLREIGIPEINIYQ